MNSSAALASRRVVEAYARAWNCLDSTELIEMLAEDVKYTSQWVFEELVGKATVAQHLSRKMIAIAQSNSRIRAEVAATEPGRFCVLMWQGDLHEPRAVVLIATAGERICAIDVCIPELVCYATE